MFNSADDRHEFKPLLVEIEERPLNPLGRAVFWIVIMALLFACLWMIFGQVDVVVTARGKVIPSGEIKRIQPLNSGVVRSILVEAGDYVTKGQVLLEIDPSDVDPELASLRADLKQVELEVVRIDALLQNREFHVDTDFFDVDVLRVQQEIYSAEQKRLQQKVQAKQEVLLQLDEQLAVEQQVAGQSEYMTTLLTDRLTRLEQVRDIISRDEYETTQSELQRYRTELESSRHHSAELRARKLQTFQEIAFIREDERNRLLTDLAEKKQRQLYLQAQIEQTEFRSSRQQITAPVDGHVSRLLFHTIGGVVTPAEDLAYIVPAESPLLVKALLLNKDAGFVARGMDASIKIDTFNFQKYGTIEGKVLQVSRDSMEDEHLGLVYEIYIDPGKNTLLVDGVDTPIVPGMSVTAEVKVGKRRIIEFFLYPVIKYLDEGISVR
ncbi:MAG: HlyD family type I secretion periplasmic adaptor subunit [Desulfuromonadales bacterium]|nr:HlyD family type I secretion periplasmic adaptor subunit [Desulfuromonadales bacterium]MBN2792163.1 HlyD family type I secretion periplasmic adaptor subunit [Desulfuromonadales bacterium]